MRRPLLALLPPRRVALSAILAALVLALLLTVLSGMLPLSLQGALFQRNPAIPDPLTGLFISQGYQAQPKERGSVLLQAGETLSGFEGLSLTVAVDPARAQLLRVRRTAVTQNFDISMNFPARGVLHVTLVGEPRQVNQGASLLEITLGLADNTVNRLGDRIDLRLLSASYLIGSTTLRHDVHDGRITVSSNQNALTLPFTPFIADIDPGIFPLVQRKVMVIRGQSLPISPTVLLGRRPISVVSASATEIVATIPEDMLPGTYPVSVDSILAEEQVVVFDAPGTLGTVDILEELIVVSPNPVLYGEQTGNVNLMFWVPVYDPVNGSVNGSVDLSSLRLDPNVTFSGEGERALGPGGTMISWFRIPASRTLTLPRGLQTNVDYPITIRVENSALTRDQATVLVQLRSFIPQGSAPFFGRIETVPSAPQPGDRVTFYADVTDVDGVDSVDLVTMRLTSIGGGIETLNPAIQPPRGDTPLQTTTYFKSFELPDDLSPGVYALEFSARDEDGNQASKTFSFTVAAVTDEPPGSPPEFSGRLEAVPPAAAPGASVTFFASVRDPDGTETIQNVLLDLIDVRGGVMTMAPSIALRNIGTLPLVYEAKFTLPATVPAGNYQIRVRAIDKSSLEAQTTIPLTVDPSLGGGAGSPNAPEFAGRLEAVPSTAALGEEVTFFVGVRHSQGAEKLRQVRVDLVDIGGSIIELLPVVPPVIGSTQPLIYSTRTTVPRNATPGFYSLRVEAFDEDGNTVQTTLPFTVSSVAQRGSIPTITQLFARPEKVPPDGKAKVKFTVEVEDFDGVEGSIVSINLAPIDRGVVFLKLDTASLRGQKTKGIFTSEDVTIPTTVEAGGYDLTVEVEDPQGNLARKTLRLTVGSTSLGGDAPILRESRFVPDIVQPGEDTRLFLEAEDENGTDSLTVVADLTDLRLDVVKLDSLVSFSEGTVSTQSTFATSTVKIPEKLQPGVYDVRLIVTDDTGNSITGGARIRVERAGAEEGFPPHIDVSRVFQVPRVFTNDDVGAGEVQVPVLDADDDVLTVLVNLRDIARASSASVSDGIGDIALLCSESRSLACMRPGVLEDVSVRWFILKDITVPPTTLPSTDPYLVEVTAIDAEGHTAIAEIPLQIGGEGTVERLKVPPKILTIVPVDGEKLEVVVSAPIDSRTVDRGGGQFLIYPTLDAHSPLRVTRVSWDTTGRLLYLHTEPLLPGESYTFKVLSSGGADSPPLTDVYGNRFSADVGGSVAFAGYEATGEEPAIEKVELVDLQTLDVHFTTQVLPSTVHPDLLPSRATLVSTVSGEHKSVKSGVLSPDARKLRLNVETLREGDRLRLRINDILAPGLIAADTGGVEAVFLALFPSATDLCPLILPTADLNEDGVVDFADFALFSAVYNTEYDFDPDKECVLASGRPRDPSSIPDFEQAEQTFGGPLPDLEVGGRGLPRVDNDNN